jgi:hypothetical protein
MFSFLNDQQNLLKNVCLFLAFVAVMFYLFRGIGVLRYRYHLDNVEGYLLDQVSKVHDLSLVYPLDFSVQPLLPAAYPPLFHIILYPFYAIFGPSFLYGRLISIVSFFIIAVYVFKFLFLTTKKSKFAIIIASLLFTNIYLIHWSQLMRVDTLALAFAVSGLYYGIEYAFYKETSKKTLAHSFVLVVASILVRQSYLLSVPLTLAFVFYKKKGLLFSLFFISSLFFVAGSFFAFFEVISKGGFLFNIIYINRVMGLSFFQLIGLQGAFIIYNIILILGIFIFNQITFSKSKKRNDQLNSVFLLFLFLSFISSLTVAKNGANINYFFELILAVILLFGFQANIVLDSKSVQVKQFIYKLILFHFLFSFFIVSFFHFIQPRDWFFTDLWVLYNNGFENAEIEKIIEKSKGLVLTDFSSSIFPLVGKSPYIETFAMTELAKRGVWDQKSILNDLEEQKFEYIVLANFFSPEEFWTEEILDTMKENYDIIEYDSLESYTVYSKKTTFEN